MKRVIIVRHAKSVQYGYDDDFNRDLTERGENDAQTIGNELRKRGIAPDVMIASPAKRALKTARIYADCLNFDKNRIIENEDIYDGLTTSEFVGLIRDLPETSQTVCFFGHNPGFHYLAGNLAGDFYGDMPTCSTVAIDFDVDEWGKVQARAGKTAFQLVPRNF